MMKDEFPECPICNSASDYESSGILGNYVQCRVCMAKWQLFTKHNQISELMLHELPKDDSSVYTVVSRNAPLFTALGTRLPALFWRNLKLDERVNWEFLSANVDPDVSEAVITQEGERLLHQWGGTREIREMRVFQGNTVQTKRMEEGVLLLSTRRLLWLARRTRGFWKTVTSFVVVDDIPLEQIRGISGETGDSKDWSIPKRISVADKEGENAFNLRYSFLEVFKPIVEQAIEIRRKEIDAEKKKERLHIMLDFSFLKTHMEKGGLVMKALKCPECGASIDFPKKGTQTKCSYCGKTIYAQDIFEKVKSLLE